jgi:putative endonuclease
MNWRQRLAQWWNQPPSPPVEKPEHLRRGRLGEDAAKAHLQAQGLKFIAANFRDLRAGRGEIDLIFRDPECLAFVEVKTRTRGQWTRPAAAVTKEKRRLLSATAAAYIRQLKTRDVRWRFDIVEVLLENGEVREIRHLPNAFPGDERYRFL